MTKKDATIHTRTKPPAGGQGGHARARTGVPAGAGGPTGAPSFARAHSAPMQWQLKRANPTPPDSGQTARPGRQSGNEGNDPKS
jgi:hypothetical protein